MSTRSSIWIDDDKPVGFISLVDAEVGAIFVYPDSHGQGIGRALMAKAFTLHDYLELDVFEANPIGRRFYSRYGFTPIDRYIHVESGQPTLRLGRENPPRARRS